MPFGLRIGVGQRNRVLHEGSDRPMGRDNFKEQEARPAVKHTDSVHELCNSCSAVAEMGDRRHNRHGPKRGGGGGLL